MCDRAADHGLLVGLEWVPSMTNIGDAPTALRIVTDADRDNGGFCVDSWHFTRSTNDLDHLRQLPGDKVIATQWNDGTVVPQHPDYLQDCLTNRVPPGDGEFALVEIARILDSIGSTAPVGVEVCSADLWAGRIDHAAQVSADGMRRVLAARALRSSHLLARSPPVLRPQRTAHPAPRPASAQSRVASSGDVGRWRSADDVSRCTPPPSLSSALLPKAAGEVILERREVEVSG